MNFERGVGVRAAASSTANWTVIRVLRFAGGHLGCDTRGEPTGYIIPQSDIHIQERTKSELPLHAISTASTHTP